MNRTGNQEKKAFVRGYVQAVADFAAWNGQLTPADVLSSAGITRDVALQCGAGEYDVQRLDEKEGWPPK